MKLSISILIVAAIVSALQHTTVAADKDESNKTGSSTAQAAQGSESLDPKVGSCGGKQIRFQWQRYFKATLVDSDWTVGVPGRTIYNVYNKGDGRVIKVAVSMPPYTGDDAPPEMIDGVRYYDGRFPGVGTITAEGVDPNWETWRFTYDGYEIVDAEGFIAGQQYDVKVKSELATQWEQEWSLSFKNGAWVAMTSSNNVADFLYGSPGSQPEEIDPDLQGLGWTEVKLSSGLGFFFGRSHAIGEVWTVSVNGQTFSAMVTAKDPNAVGLLE